MRLTRNNDGHSSGLETMEILLMIGRSSDDDDDDDEKTKEARAMMNS